MGEKRLTANSIPARAPSWLKACQNTPLSRAHVSSIFKPILVDMEQSATAPEELARIIQNSPISRVVDVFDEQLAELFISENAQLYKTTLEVKKQSVKQYLASYKKGRDSWQLGSWVYYPWSGLLVHILGRETFTKLRTLRNAFLITSEEQRQYAAFRVGCAGMSVGSNGAAALALSGGSSQIKLADGAVFSGSNLNRVRTGIDSIGLPKAIITARELYEMNPYLEVDAITQNLTAQNVAKFFDKPWKIDVVVDEIDDIIAKIILRIEARKRRIPVVMVTEPGDTMMLDVERYDLDSSVPLFHGLMDDPEEIARKGSFKNERERIKNIVTVIGIRNLPLRDQKAALKVGSVIPSAPQLGSTAMMAGGLIAYAVRQIATNAPLKSGRHTIDLNKLLWQPKQYLSYRVQHHRNSRNLARIIQNM